MSLACLCGGQVHGDVGRSGEGDGTAEEAGALRGREQRHDARAAARLGARGQGQGEQAGRGESVWEGRIAEVVES